jgi:hypothetical protein
MKEIELEVSLEGRRRRVADILEMGGSENVSETKKETWVTNIWKVPQQRDGSAYGIYMVATDIALTRGWSLQDSTSAEQIWVRKGSLPHMVPEGDPHKYGQSPSWTLRSVWRG